MKIERLYGGVGFRLKDRFWRFYWRPVCPSWVDTTGKIVKSKKFQFLTFEINKPLISVFKSQPTVDEKKGNTMDQITDQMKQAHEHEAQVLAAAPIDGTEVVTQGPEDVGEDTPVVI